MPNPTERQQRFHRCDERQADRRSRHPAEALTTFTTAMTAAQARLADTIDVFYGAADKTSEGAMAAHAYKRAVEELDTGIGREMVRPSPLAP